MTTKLKKRGGRSDEDIEVVKRMWKDGGMEGLGSWLLVHLFCNCEHSRSQIARYVREREGESEDEW